MVLIRELILPWKTTIQNFASTLRSVPTITYYVLHFRYSSSTSQVEDKVSITEDPLETIPFKESQAGYGGISLAEDTNVFLDKLVDNYLEVDLAKTQLKHDEVVIEE